MNIFKKVAFLFSSSTLLISCGSKNNNLDTTPSVPTEQDLEGETNRTAVEITSEEQSFGIAAKCVCGKFVLRGCNSSYKNIRCVNDKKIIATGFNEKGRSLLWLKK